MAREQRYPSDLSDAEWVVVEPLLPAPTSHPRGGRPEKRPRRDIVDAILFVVQDRDGARQLLLELRHRQIMSRAAPRVRHLFADSGFAGVLVDWAHTLLKTTIEVVRKPQDQKGFAVIPRRWAVERTFAWITGYRRLARDYERHPATAEAIVRWAAIATMTRRIARGHPATRPGPRPFTTS